MASKEWHHFEKHFTIPRVPKRITKRGIELEIGGNVGFD